MKKKVLRTPLGPAAIGPYSQAVVAGNMVFISGQIPLDPESGNLIEDKSVKAQTRRALQNLQGILAAAGVSMQNVVKTTVYLTDMKTFADMNSVYAEFFDTCHPARSTVEVSRLPKDVNVEIDCIAMI